MHFLKDHLIEWIKRFEVGMALHNEQGGEGIHCVFNKLKTIHSDSRDPLSRLTSMMKDHLTKCSPRIQNYTVQPQKRAKHDK